MKDDNSIYEPHETRNPKAIYHGKEFSIREYFDIKMNLNIDAFMNYDPESTKREIEYTTVVYCKEDVYKEYHEKNNKVDIKLTLEDQEILEQDFKDLEPKLLKLMEYIQIDEYTEKVYAIKPFKIIMYNLYLVTRFYMLYKSMHTLFEYQMLRYYLIIYKLEIAKSLKYYGILVMIALIRYSFKK